MRKFSKIQLFAKSTHILLKETCSEPCNYIQIVEKSENIKLHIRTKTILTQAVLTSIKMIDDRFAYVHGSFPFAMVS